MNNRLSIAVRHYRILLSRIDLGQSHSIDYKQTAEYLRGLYREYGREAVRKELERQQ